MDQTYTDRKEPMRVFWMFSGGASSLKATLEDPNNGLLYVNVGAYTDKEDAKGRSEVCKPAGIPDIFISRKDFYRQQGLDPKHPDSRRRFYEMLRREKIEPFKPDIVCLSGYMHIVSDPLLEYKILNVHPADLTILTGPTVERLDASQVMARQAKKMIDANKLQRKLKGEKAVHDAIRFGETATRSTVHMATEIFDEGPIVVQSRPFEVRQEAIEGARSGGDAFDAYASSLQEFMKTEGDGPAYLKALELFATRRVRVWGDTLFLDGKEMPYCGVRLG